jgi:hypothetical protein
LQIALGFEHAGAKLKLTVRAPNGQVIEHQDESVYQIDIPAADPGAWRWTVTPIALPHDHFPVVVAAASAPK